MFSTGFRLKTKRYIIKQKNQTFFGNLRHCTKDIRMIYSNKKTSRRTSMEQQIRRMLTDLGIYSKTKGFFFLIEAIEIYINSNEEQLKITENVYPTIAEKFRTTPSNVERSIRYTISELYKSPATDRYISLFGDPQKRRKPTNTEFITSAAYEIKSCMTIK